MSTEPAIVIQGAESSNINALSMAPRNNIQGTDNPDILFGTEGDDDIFGLGGDDTILGTLGSDVLNGGTGFDTVDYNTLGRAITLLPRGGVGGSVSSQLVSIERIIGAAGKANAIDASGSLAEVNIVADLSANSITINNIPGIGSQTFTIENFVNVTGTPGADTIIGNGARNKLDGSAGDDTVTGGAGNDAIVGGDGNDLLLGTNSSARGASELDTLTGGAGTDKFILGDNSGSYYKFAGRNDFARIQDFAFGEQIQLGTGDTYNIQRKDSGFNLFAVTGGGNDLIADVRLVSGATSNNARTATPDALALVPEGDFQIASGQTLGVFVGA